MTNLQWPPPSPWNDVTYEGWHQSPYWVFAYGSLMWNPVFPWEESQQACLNGYHRDACIYSWVYRGTEQDPGLVMGLDNGGSCPGKAFRVSEDNHRSVLVYLIRRELVTAVYKPVVKAIQLENGKQVDALTFIVDRTSPQYAGCIPVNEAACIIKDASGLGGENFDYLENTVHHLRDMGMPCSRLEAIYEELQSLD